MFGDFLQYFHEWFAADHAGDALIGQRHAAFHRQDELAVIFFDHGFQMLLKWFAGGCGQGIGVFERNQVQNQV